MSNDQSSRLRSYRLFFQSREFSVFVSSVKEIKHSRIFSEGYSLKRIASRCNGQTNKKEKERPKSVLGIKGGKRI